MGIEIARWCGCTEVYEQGAFKVQTLGHTVCWLSPSISAIFAPFDTIVTNSPFQHRGIYHCFSSSVHIDPAEKIAFYGYYQLIWTGLEILWVISLLFPTILVKSTTTPRHRSVGVTRKMTPQGERHLAM